MELKRGAGRMKEYTPRQGFFDITKKPKGLSKRDHKKMQETQMMLQKVEDEKEHHLKHDLHNWSLAKEMSAMLQQLIFKWYPNILDEELEE